MLDGIPPSQATDSEDVVWALQTADSLWKRNERVDAIVWLRRAAQAAGDAQDDDRALALARGAAELAELLVTGSTALAVSPSVPPSPADDLSIDALLDAPVALADTSPPDSSRTQSTAPTAHPPYLSEMAREMASGNVAEVPTAAQAHAGMLDPWATEAISDHPVAGRTGRPLPSLSFDDDEVVTSVITAALRPGMLSRAAEAPTHPPAESLSDPPGPSVHAIASLTEDIEEPVPVSSVEVMSARSGAAALRATRPPPLPSVAAPPLPPRTSPPPSRLPSEIPAPSARPTLAETVAPKPPRPPVEALPTRPAPAVDLTEVSAFAALTISARDGLAQVAILSKLEKDEETSGFALALVIEGEVDVAATIVDAPVKRYAAGSILRSRGSIDEEISIRLICASERAVVATWKDATVLEALRDYPLVEAGLRAAANEMQALVGVSMGPLGERLDKALREVVTNRLHVRGLAAGDVVVAQGQPMPGLVVIGVGELELVTDGEVRGTLGPGEFLFATEVISSGRAPSTARAAKGGALVMAADRAVAQELLVTCPPLLELFAGM